MSRTKSASLPSLRVAGVEEQEPAIVPMVKEEPTPEAGTISVTVPTFAWEKGYARRKLDVKLTESQALTLRGITLGLERQEAQLANGKNVANPVDAIRWMLENVR